MKTNVGGRNRWIVLTIFPVLLGVASCDTIGASSTGEYFPSALRSEITNASGSAMALDVYSRTLSQMGQASIYAPCSASNAETIRFLYLPFSNGIRVAINVVRRSKSTHLTYAMLGQSGEDKPSIGAIDISDEDWRALQQAAHDVKLFEMRSVSSKTGVDGQNLVFETCHAHRYHFVDRWITSDEDQEQKLVELGERFISLARLSIRIRPVIVREGKQ